MQKSFITILSCLLLLPGIYSQNRTTDSPEDKSEKPEWHDLRFRNIGPATMSGRIVDLAVQESDLYTFYVATATGGVWKTTNNGVTFRPVFENEATHSVGDIALHQAYPNHLWVGTGERANRQSNSWGDGVYYSRDAGKTWKNVGLKDSHHIGRIVLHPNDTSTAYVAAMGHLWGPNEERGLYRTTDGGDSWERLLYIDENTGVVDVAMEPGNPEVLYASTYQRRRRPYGFHGGGPGSGLYKSTDGGATWKELTSGLPEGDKGRIGISIYKADPSIVYVSVEQGFQYNASTAYNRRKAGIYRSEDRGETWTFMSDWNPRPMYASQILVDPNDDQRIYMMNSYSYSDDGGKTFTRARQSLHGDDRIFWVNPTDSEHVMKGDDGGLGISYDRGKTWLYVSSLPVSQFYRVSVDNRKPYRIYGGLQDNGSWMGPSETYLRDGIRNSEWVKTGGGDGFINLIHPEDENILFVESQYLGLSRLDLRTMQRKDIRPGDPRGHISPRRNWDAWGPNEPEPELGNAMAPANWDGPYIISSHAPHALYAGTNKLWKSTDMGDSWEEIGDLTTGVNRRLLKIMGQEADSLTASLDDGIPYYPTLSVIAESPLMQGWLMVGTDDGQLQVSEDDGENWREISGRLPELPDDVWFNSIEFSKFDEDVIYVVANNYRNNDFKNYVFRSDNGGRRWKSIAADLPENRVARTVREDTRNRDILYLATELGLFISFDRGESWEELRNNMPTLPFNDLVIHPRDNDLILGSHGRGIWILDNLNPLQQLPVARDESFYVFEIPDAEMIAYSRAGAHLGDMHYSGENPVPGSFVDYYFATAVKSEDAKLEIRDIAGETISTLKMDTTAGVHRQYWNFRMEGPEGPKENPADSTEQRRSWWGVGLTGQQVLPGTYQVVLTYRGEEKSQTFEVRNDPRLDITPEVQRDWYSFVSGVSDFYEELVEELNRVNPVRWKLEALKKEGKVSEGEDLDFVEFRFEQYDELTNRARSLYWSAGSYIGLPTEDQRMRLDYYRDKLEQFRKDEDGKWTEALENINARLDEEDRLDLPVLSEQD